MYTAKEAKKEQKRAEEEAEEQAIKEKEEAQAARTFAETEGEGIGTTGKIKLGLDDEAIDADRLGTSLRI